MIMATEVETRREVDKLVDMLTYHNTDAIADYLIGLLAAIRRQPDGEEILQQVYQAIREMAALPMVQDDDKEAAYFAEHPSHAWPVQRDFYDPTEYRRGAVGY